MFIKIKCYAFESTYNYSLYGRGVEIMPFVLFMASLDQTPRVCEKIS